MDSGGRTMVGNSGWVRSDISTPIVAERLAFSAVAKCVGRSKYRLYRRSPMAIAGITPARMN